MGPAAGGRLVPQSHPDVSAVLLMILVVWFLLIRPQRKRAKEHTNLLASLQKGDRVVTNSGMLGTIVGINEGESTLVLKVGRRHKDRIPKVLHRRQDGEVRTGRLPSMRRPWTKTNRQCPNLRRCCLAGHGPRCHGFRCRAEDPDRAPCSCAETRPCHWRCRHAARRAVECLRAKRRGDQARRQAGGLCQRTYPFGGR